VPNPFDAASKGLIDADPIAWLRLFGLPGETVEPVDSDLTLALTSDRLLRVSSPGKTDYLAHFEMQTTYSPSLPHRIMAYHVTAGYKYELPVVSVLMLLRKTADGPMLTGRFQFGSAQVDYQIVRIWERSPDDLLAGPVALVPLLPLTNVSEQELPAYIRQAQAIVRQLPAPYERDVWTRMRLLLGLKYKPDQTQDLLKGVYQMLDLRESSTYQEILAEGEARGLAEGEARGLAEGEARGLHEGKEELLAILLQQRFSTLSQSVTDSLDKLSSEQMNELGKALFNFTSFADLEGWLLNHQ